MVEVSEEVTKYFSELGKKSAKSKKHYYGFSDPKVKAKILESRRLRRNVPPKE